MYINRFIMVIDMKKLETNLASVLSALLAEKKGTNLSLFEKLGFTLAYDTTRINQRIQSPDYYAASFVGSSRIEDLFERFLNNQNPVDGKIDTAKAITSLKQYVDYSGAEKYLGTANLNQLDFGQTVSQTLSLPRFNMKERFINLNCVEDLGLTFSVTPSVAVIAYDYGYSPADPNDEDASDNVWRHKSSGCIAQLKDHTLLELCATEDRESECFMFESCSEIFKTESIQSVTKYQASFDNAPRIRLKSQDNEYSGLLHKLSKVFGQHSYIHQNTKSKFGWKKMSDYQAKKEFYNLRRYDSTDDRLKLYFARGNPESYNSDVVEGSVIHTIGPESGTDAKFHMGNDGLTFLVRGLEEDRIVEVNFVKY